MAGLLIFVIFVVDLAVTEFLPTPVITSTVRRRGQKHQKFGQLFSVLATIIAIIQLMASFDYWNFKIENFRGSDIDHKNFIPQNIQYLWAWPTFYALEQWITTSAWRLQVRLSSRLSSINSGLRSFIAFMCLLKNFKWPEWCWCHQ